MFGFNFFKRKKKNVETSQKEQYKTYPAKSHKPVLQSVSNEQQNLMHPLNPLNPIYVNVSETKHEKTCEPYKHSVQQEPVCSRYEDSGDRYSGGDSYSSDGGGSGGGGGGD